MEQIFRAGCSSYIKAGNGSTYIQYMYKIICSALIELMFDAVWVHFDVSIGLVPISTRAIDAVLNMTKYVQVLIEVSFVHNIVRSLLPYRYICTELWCISTCCS